MLTGLWRRNPAWRAELNLKAFQRNAEDEQAEDCSFVTEGKGDRLSAEEASKLQLFYYCPPNGADGQCD